MAAEDSFWDKHKFTIIVVGILLVIAAIIAIYFMGKNAGKTKPPKVDYPHGGDDIPANWNAEPLANELHDVMDGLFTLSGTKDATFTKYADIATDEMFIAVYDTFNQLYMSEGDGTLREWISDELWTDIGTDSVDRIMDRMDNLNLQFSGDKILDYIDPEKMECDGMYRVYARLVRLNID